MFRNEEAQQGNADSEMLKAFTQFAIAEPRFLDMMDSESFKTFLQDAVNVG